MVRSSRGASPQSAIEETLQRIESQSGVTGYVIVDDEGNILRNKRGMPPAEARALVDEMRTLVLRAVHAVRDLDPKNNLQFFRVRARDVEVLAAPGPGFLVLVKQSWTPSDWASEEK